MTDDTLKLIDEIVQKELDKFYSDLDELLYDRIVSIVIDVLNEKENL